MTIGLRAAMALGKDMLQGTSAQDHAALDVRLLMAEALGLSSADVVIAPDAPLTDHQEADFFAMIGLRRNGQSVAHIVGYREFWSRRFIVTSDVLVPRPETEVLIDLALKAPFNDVLDLGTGSGCIAITLLAERPDACGIATDLSQLALDVAMRNADRHGVTDRIHFEVSDWFAAVGGRFDLIVSNPPYITQDAYAALAPEVLAEPRLALTPGGDGLEPYRRITHAAPTYLRPGGRLLMEIGFDQGAAVAELFEGAGFTQVKIIQDLSGHDRVVSGNTP